MRKEMPFATGNVITIMLKKGIHYCIYFNDDNEKA
jgi:hypothetical protein